MEFQAHTSLVRRSLAANFIFSGICALLLLANPNGIAETMFTSPEVWFGLPAGRLLLGLGLALFLFGQLVLFFTVRKRISKPGVQFIIYNDLAWVVLSGAALLVGMGFTTGWGVAIIVVVALVVLFFAINQFLGLKFLYQGNSKVTVDQDGYFVVMTASRKVNASSKKAWKVMVDHERYSDVADNLTNVEILGDQKMGRGMERRCTGNKGESWTEHAHIWDEGSRYGFIVNTKDPNYPYPLESLNAIWSVEEIEPNQSEVAMQMRLQPKRGLKGGLFMIAMVPMFATVVDKLLGLWASKMEV
ncbi:SRPBCC family protein [Sphingorhabdus sp. Alg231-15]|uniref:SRPBCC family protein n=1 Tax=Sphingorhabdus sp. Alg231-15 TaxID=1922222 RepID=UPI000D55F5BF